jgi:YggT family protein
VITILFDVVLSLLNLYWWAVILTVVVSMLISFNVLDTRNRVVWSIADFLDRVTEPALRRIRRLLPNLGPIDISPLILLILIWASEAFIVRIRDALVYGNLRGLLL